MYNVVKGNRMNKLSDYITIKDAAEILGICEMTLRRWDESGKLKTYRNPANKYRLYKKSELKAFLSKISKG
jgi:excisionase family DNA binding protein